MIEEIILKKTIMSVLVILTALIIILIVKSAIKRKILHKRITNIKDHPGYKMIKVLIIIFVLLILLIVWGVGGNFWIFISSVLGLVAIGFVAVWSILSNVLTGLILLFSRSFNKGDEIVLLPDNIQGKIEELDFMFVFLKDKKGNVLQIPNNMIFQKIVKKVKKK